MTTTDTPARSVRLDLSDLVDLDRLALTPDATARLTATQAGIRLDDLMAESEAILTAAIQRMVLNDRRSLAGVVGLFSGGNDSTVTCDLIRRLGYLTHTGHANTGVGVEATRQYVRDTSAAWGIPLIERMAPNPNDAYQALVLSHGFPGAARHQVMFNRLKDHALRQVRAALVANPMRERVVFVAGRRRTESDQRNDVPELERIGSTVWVSPLVNWTKPDMNAYRRRFGDVPRNQVADLCHMSAECLCGSYARPGERDEVSQWYPEAFDLIAELERRLAGPEGDHLPPHVKVWGWQNDPTVAKPKRVRKPRPVRASAANLCGTCESRGPHDHGGDVVTVAR